MIRVAQNVVRNILNKNANIINNQPALANYWGKKRMAVQTNPLSKDRNVAHAPIFLTLLALISVSIFL